MTVARRIDRFDGRAAFTTWLYRVATNACLDELRRHRRQAPVPDRSTRHDAAPRRRRRAAGAAAPTRRIWSPTGWRSTTPWPSCRPSSAPRWSCATSGAWTTPRSPRCSRSPSGTVRSRIARGRAQLADLLGRPRTAPRDDGPRPSTTGTPRARADVQTLRRTRHRPARRDAPHRTCARSACRNRDHDRPRDPRAAAPEGARSRRGRRRPELVAVRVALAAVPEPPADQLRHAPSWRRSPRTTTPTAGAPPAPTAAARRGQRRRDASAGGRGGAAPPAAHRSRGTHRRLAAVAAASWPWPALAGLLVARNPAATPPWRHLGHAPRGLPRAARRRPRVARPTRRRRRHRPQRPARAPTTTAPRRRARRPPPRPGPPPTLGTYGDAAALLAMVRAEAAAPVHRRQPPAPPQPSDRLARAAAGGLRPPGGSALGDAVIGGTRCWWCSRRAHRTPVSVRRSASTSPPTARSSWTSR